MKIILAKNKISSSQKKILKAVQEWYSPVFDLEFTEEKINKSITYGGYYFYDTDGSIKYFQAVDETWYDQNISIPYQKQGYDVSILLLREKDWDGSIYDTNGNYVKNSSVGGFGNCENDQGIEEIALPYDKSGTYNFDGVELEGNKLVWTIIHELAHRFYEMKGLLDNTHKYFLLGTPEKCLEDFKMKTAILTRQESSKKQTLGELVCTNGNNTFICKTLELPWLNNKKDISCILPGVYLCKKSYWKQKGYDVYDILNVQYRSGIKIHAGNYYSQILGCILVGKTHTDINKDGYKDVTSSRDTLKALINFFGGSDFTLIIK